VNSLRILADDNRQSPVITGRHDRKPFEGAAFDYNTRETKTSFGAVSQIKHDPNGQ